MLFILPTNPSLVNRNLLDLDLLKAKALFNRAASVDQHPYNFP